MVSKNGMKLTGAVLLAGMALALLSAAAVGTGRRDALAAETSLGEIPTLVLDETAGHWVVDRFAGNTRAGPEFFQGPAREVGGLRRCAVTTTPDGSVFLGTGWLKWANEGIARVAPDGTLRLVAGGGSSLADGPASQARVLISRRGAALLYSPADDSIYFVHSSIPAVRRLFRKNGQWWVETVAGNPLEAGNVDGPVKQARFNEPRSMAITSTGTIYLSDLPNRLCKVEKGQVTTLVEFKRGQEIVDGPLSQATLAITNMSGQIALGENDHTLYVADHWHFAVRKIDLKSMTISTVMNGRMRSKHSDGPALTHAHVVSGCAFACWDPVHKALWFGGPDEHRFRWLKDGWVKTVIGRRGGRWPKDSPGVPGGQVSLTWSNVAAVDAKGGVYLVAASERGVWRAHLKGKR